MNHDPKIAVALLAAMLVACPAEEGENNIETPVGESKCERDDVATPADAEALTLGQEIEGFVCPVEDEDWFRITIPSTNKLFTIGLEMSAPLSAVQPSYALFGIEGGEPGVAVAQPPSTDIGAKLNFTHCVDPGEYFLVVRDSGNDAQDFRHPYKLTTSSGIDPDSNEPNDGGANASAIQLGSPQTGYIACRGDEDHFTIDVPDGKLLSIELVSEIAQYEPTVRLFTTDGELLVEEANPSGSVVATEIQRFEVPPAAGSYTLVVSDDDGQQADPSVPYTLTVRLIDDDDPNEPNNHPDEATPIAGSAVNCGAAFSSRIEHIGTIGSPGDDDWFELRLAGCDQGILEAELELQTGSLSPQQQWDLAAQVQGSLTVVRAHPETACQTDEDCNSLNAACEEPLDCAGLFETCLGDGLCAGATACLPGGSCGANVRQRFWECPPRTPECTPGSNPPPMNGAKVSMPLAGETLLYLRVSDFQSDGSAPDTTYTLNVRVRADPDQHEVNNLFTNEIQQPLRSGDHRPFAVDIPVHDCTAGDCCGGGNWIEGSIGYEFDLDWFRYQHPCPGQDCTMRVHYEVDGGPVDTVMNIYRGGSLWFSAYDVEEEMMQGGLSGTLGGTTAADTCFYAYQGHDGDPFYYYLMVRDLNALYSDDLNIRPESRDWDSDQNYRFCVEKITNDCSVPPCQLYPDGCGQPQ